MALQCLLWPCALDLCTVPVFQGWHRHWMHGNVLEVVCPSSSSDAVAIVSAYVEPTRLSRRKWAIGDGVVVGTCVQTACLFFAGAFH